MSVLQRPGRRQRRKHALALALALVAAIVPFAARSAAGPPGATVHVRWRPALDPATRQQLEVRFRLADGQRLDSNTWRYDFLDPSAANIRALVANPAAEDTYGINRPRSELEPSTIRTARRQRLEDGSRIVVAADRLAAILSVLAGLIVALRLRSRAPASTAVRPVSANAVHAESSRRWTSTHDEPGDEDRPRLWTAAAMVASAPLVVMLCLTLWRTPFPVTESVALFEDVAEQSISFFFDANKAYYRPLSYVTLSAIWNSGQSLGARLDWIKLLTIIPVTLMTVLLIGHLRPRTSLEGAAACVAIAVLMGSPGFRDNLEIGLTDTIVGMTIALTVWILLNREPRVWHMPLIIVCLVTAIGFKEQGLALVPLVIGAWWTRARSATRSLAATTAILAVAYVLFRLNASGSWAPFESGVGFGFAEVDQREAAVRFGAFPYWIYAYSAASTMANVLFGEPTRGVFGIVQAVWEGRVQPWQIIQVGSSVGLTSLIGWWGACCFKRGQRGQWSPDTRAFAALALVLIATGALSFNYSRDRLAGIAVVFYAIASFFALRAAGLRMLEMPRHRFVIAGLGLVLLAATWQTRAFGTLEHARLHSWGNQREWFVRLPQRRIQFARREVYLRIMESMVDQGKDPAAPRPTRFPPGVALVIGQGR